MDLNRDMLFNKMDNVVDNYVSYLDNSHPRTVEQKREEDDDNKIQAYYNHCEES